MHHMHGITLMQMEKVLQAVNHLGPFPLAYGVGIARTFWASLVLVNLATCSTTAWPTRW